MSVPNKSTDHISVRDGTALHCEKTCGGSDSWLICVHGIGEHIGRETHLSELFVDRYNILRYDLRGHGKSSGKRGYIKSFAIHYCDLEDVVSHLASAHSNFRYTLFGHSMGALIAAGFVQRCSAHVPSPERLFLSSPPIGIGGRGGAIVNRLPRSLFNWLRKLPFSIPIGSALNRQNLSHEKSVATHLKQDPLSLKRLHTKLLLNLVEASKDVFSRPITTACPIYCAIGSEDRIVSCPEAKRYFATHEPNATLLIVKGAYHELHNESEEYREPYFAFLKQVLNANTG